MKITLRQIEVFVAIANHHGHVTNAAQSVSMTQAAASMAIADFEKQLGTRLFDRAGKQLTLNETGRLLLQRAQEIIDRAHDLQDLAIGRDSLFDIRIGASVTVGNHLLPALLAKIKQEHTNGNIHILRLNTEQVLARLLDFSIEVGFVEGPVEDSRYIWYPWLQDELAIFCAPDHPLAGRVLKPQDIAGAKWVMREQGSGTRKVFERACATKHISPLVSLELEQPEAIKKCVQAGLGLGCLSILELESSFSSQELVRLSVPCLDLKRGLNVVLNRNKFISQGVSTILKECGAMVNPP